MVSKYHLHGKGARQRRGALAYGVLTNDPERRTKQITDVVAEKSDLF